MIPVKFGSKLLIFTFMLAISLLISLSACSSSTPTATSQAPTTTSSATPVANKAAVTIAGFAFSPQTLTVAKGTSITWTNNDSTTHTVTSDSGIWDSGDLAPGKTFSYTFNQTGTFPYYCKIHPSMTAKVTAQ